MGFSIVICGDAGKGRHNPYIALEPDIRKAIVIGLHAGQSAVELARSSGISENEISRHIASLREGGFVKTQNGEALPNFFVALRNDVVRVQRASVGLGRSLGEIYETRWKSLVKTYNELSVSSRFGFDRVGFVLIGAHSLDMMGKFAEEGKIMPRAPKRKTGRYYLWGVEDGLESLGRYGMHSDICRRYGYATFGGEKDRRRTSPPDHVWSIIASEMNETDLRVAYLKLQKLLVSERKNLEGRVERLTHRVLKEYERKYKDESYELSRGSENYLRRWLYVDENRAPSAPIYSEEDMEILDAFVDDMAVHILDTVRGSLGAINTVFKKCRASKYASFSEFFCWYYHLAFAKTMDYLIKKQRLSQPQHGYEFWLWKT
jgi:DNA-binding transcriptional ArsR family regulator